MTIVKISRKNYEDCREFSEELDKTKGFYGRKRGQFNEKVRIEQGTVGKCAEFAAYKYLLQQGVGVNLPSLVILKKAKWDVDLQFDDYKFHIKSCRTWDNNPEYRYSWTFQAGCIGKQSKGHVDPLVSKFTTKAKNDNNYVVFVQQVSKLKYEVCKIMPAYYLHKYNLLNFIDGVDKDYLKGIKQFVRYDGSKWGIKGLKDIPDINIKKEFECN